MVNESNFEMAIVEVFHFSNGRTVFVGPIQGANYIEKCRCELIIDGMPRGTIQLEGEMMPNSLSVEGYRSVSTRDPVVLESQSIALAECRLRSVLT